MVASSQIQPFHLFQILTKLFFKSPKRNHQIIGILLTERMKMKPFHTFQQIFPKLCLRHTKP